MDKAFLKREYIYVLCFTSQISTERRWLKWLQLRQTLKWRVSGNNWTTNSFKHTQSRENNVHWCVCVCVCGAGRGVLLLIRCNSPIILYSAKWHSCQTYPLCWRLKPPLLSSLSLPHSLFLAHAHARGRTHIRALKPQHIFESPSHCPAKSLPIA